MRNPTDLARELTKISDVVSVAVEHFDHEAKMNAALHMASEVRPAPLATALKGAHADLHRLVEELVNEPSEL
jgi:hypothetical protein